MSDTATKLVVLLHGYTCSPSKMKHVRDSVLAKYKDADLFIPELPTSVCSFVDPVYIVRKILIQIDRLCVKRKRNKQNQYEEIILIGHSLGALLVRKLYVYACGARVNALKLSIIKNYHKSVTELARKKCGSFDCKQL